MYIYIYIYISYTYTDHSPTWSISGYPMVSPRIIGYITQMDPFFIGASSGLHWVPVTTVAFRSRPFPSGLPEPVAQWDAQQPGPRGEVKSGTGTLNERSSRQTFSGWWWLEHDFYDFPIYWECHHPNWRTHIFQMGWNHQPVTCPNIRYIHWRYIRYTSNDIH